MTVKNQNGTIELSELVTLTNSNMLYTWIKYADDEKGANMSDNPVGKDYVGIAYNKKTLKESEKPEDYTWSKTKGEQGDKGENGVEGPKGDSGRTTYFHIKYSAIPNPQHPHEMQEEPSTYIGTYVDFEKEDSQSPMSYRWHRFEGMQGPTGEQGLDGGIGPEGKPAYLHIKYSNDGGKTLTYPNGETPGDWIGQYVDDQKNDSKDVRRYTWSKIKGEDGRSFTVKGELESTDELFQKDGKEGEAYIVQGNLWGWIVSPDGRGQWANLGKIKGEDGKDGITLYTWIKYADDEKGTGISDDATGKKFIGIAYNKTSQEELDDYRLYTWSKIQASDFTIEGTLDTEKDLPHIGQVGTGYIINGELWMWKVDPSTGVGSWANMGQFIGGSTIFADCPRETMLWDVVQGMVGHTKVWGNVSNWKEVNKGDVLVVPVNVGDKKDSICHIYCSVTQLPTNTNVSTLIKSYQIGPEGPEGQRGLDGLQGPRGEQGLPGDVGQGVESIVEEFYLSTSKETQTGGEWRTTSPTWSYGKYIWTRSKIIYKNPRKEEYTKPICDSSWEAVNEIEIGGTNLVSKSDTFDDLFFPTGEYEGTIEVIEDLSAICKKSVVFTCTTDGIGFNIPIFTKTPDKIGKTYTWSFWGKTSTPKSGDVGQECNGQKKVSFTTTWQKFQYTWEYSDFKYSSFTFYLDWKKGEKLYIRDFKIEKGNKATDWTPAPEDIEEAIGDNINKVDVMYYLSSSLTELKDGEWLTTAPQWEQGKYMWSKTVTILANGKRKESEPTCIAGAKGDATYFHIKYSHIENPTLSSQMQEEPAEYIGTYVDTNIKDSDDPNKYTWYRFQGLQGPKGENGLPGGIGPEGKPTYLHIKYSDDGGGSFTGNKGEDPGKYIGQYVDNILEDSMTPSMYTWSLIKGVSVIIANTKERTLTWSEIERFIGTTQQWDTIYNWMNMDTNDTIIIPIKVSDKKYAICHVYCTVTQRPTNSTVHARVIDVQMGPEGPQGEQGPEGPLLDWVQDWDSGKTTIGGEKVLTPKIFAGKLDNVQENGVYVKKPTGVAMGIKCFGTLNGFQDMAGLCAYDKGNQTFSINTQGQVFFGDPNGRNGLIDYKNGNLSITAPTITLAGKDLESYVDEQGKKAVSSTVSVTDRGLFVYNGKLEVRNTDSNKVMWVENGQLTTDSLVVNGKGNNTVNFIGKGSKYINFGTEDKNSEMFINFTRSNVKTRIGVYSDVERSNQLFIEPGSNIGKRPMVLMRGAGSTPFENESCSFSVIGHISCTEGLEVGDNVAFHSNLTVDHSIKLDGTTSYVFFEHKQSEDLNSIEGISVNGYPNCGIRILGEDKVVLGNRYDGGVLAYFDIDQKTSPCINTWTGINMHGHELVGSRSIKANNISVVETIPFYRTSDNKELTIDYNPIKTKQNMIVQVGFVDIENEEELLISFDDYIVCSETSISITPIGINRNVSVVKVDDNGYTIKGNKGRVDYTITYINNSRVATDSFVTEYPKLEVDNLKQKMVLKNK